MEEIMNDKWISIDEAAEYLGIPKDSEGTNRKAASKVGKADRP